MSNISNINSLNINLGSSFFICRVQAQSLSNMFNGFTSYRIQDTGYRIQDT